MQLSLHRRLLRRILQRRRDFNMYGVHGWRKLRSSDEERRPNPRENSRENHDFRTARPLLSA